MSTSCVPSPTATRTQVLTTDSLTTSFSASVTTAQPTVSTVTFTECLAGPTSSGSTTICRTSSSLTTIPGGTTTTSVPVVITLPITSTSLTTLFGSSCTVITSPPVSTPTTITSQTSTTLPNGSVSIGTVTVTTLITDPASPTQQSTNDNSSNSHDTNLGAIIGGAVGGVFGLIALLLVIWFLRKRRERQRWDDIFEKEDDRAVAVTGTGRHHEGSDQPSLPNVGVGILEPKPYEYGLVGSTAGPVQHYNLQPSYEGDNPHAGMAQRHSSGGSIQPLTVSGVATNAGHPPMRSPQQSYDPNNTSLSMQSGGSQGGHGHSSYHSAYHGPGYSPNQSPPLMTSRGSSPMTAGAWISSQMDGQFNPGVDGFVPVQRPTGEYFDSRGPQEQGQGQGQGSPRQGMSSPGPGHASPTWPGTDASTTPSESSQYQQRRLQVMNQDDDSPMSSQNLFVEGRSSPQAAASRPYSAPSNPVTEKQHLAAAMGQSTANPNRNSNGNGVMVHHDGGRINDNAHGEASAGPSGHDRQDPSEADNGPPPPAYEE